MPAAGRIEAIAEGWQIMFDWLISRYLRAPEHPGKLRCVRFLERTVIPDRGIVCSVAPDLRLFLHPRDAIEFLLLTGSAYEPLTLAFLAANLRAAEAAVLAGVNFGLHLSRAALAVGPSGIVVGVEPQPAALLRTRSNLEMNGLAHGVKLVQAALGRSPGVVHMAWSRPDNAGAASLLDQGGGLEIPVLRVADLVALLEDRTFRLMLLDVQGYEHEVLAGCDLQNGPEIIVVEFDPEFLARSGTSPDSIAQQLAEAGYSLHDLHGVRAVALLELPERNLVAVKRGSEVRWPGSH